MSVTSFVTPYEFHSGIDVATPNDAPSDKARCLIDQELQRLEDTIRALRSHRNVLAPISQLPPEMLSKIFAYRVAECADSTNPLEWIRVTHVSRHWRAVALDCPSLWGNLIFTRPRWSKEMLKRSKMASLFVKADLSCFTPRIFDAVRLALLHASRIQNLQLRAGSANIERLLTSGPSFQIPMIRSLSLSVPRSLRFGADEDFTLPDTVLTEETPYLRRLELHRVIINWDSQLLKGLTHLTIHDVTTSARPTTDQLMNALERMPVLEVLDIQDALPQPPDGPSSPDRIVDLPQLALLSITSTVPECVNLVSCITIPASARIHLSCSGTETTGGDFSGVMRVISNPRGAAYRQEKDGPPERKVIRVLHIQHEVPISLVVQGWTDALATDEAVPRVNAPDIQLHFSWHYPSQTTVESITASVCKAIPIARLRSLRMAYVDGFSTKMWMSTFGLLHKLHSMHVAGQSAHALVAALHEEIQIETSTSPSATPEGMKGIRRPGLCRKRSAVYFPQLKSLTMEDVSFVDGDTSATTTLSDLQNCLVERSERKAEIQELRLQECSHLLEEDVKALRYFVPSVDWDEIVQGFSEDEESEYGFNDMGGYLFGGYDVYSEDLDLGLDLDFSIF
ncbi:hypothetical protein E4T56_gene13779 [Termitomyces sp. T112]|nr:hypothetical protein E4T56_gene13779 [Termitomyces sp. T112]